MSKPITILLVDDHDLVRIGLKLSLEQSCEFEIVGHAVDGRSAVKKAMELRPDVILMDIGLPGIDGIEATWQIKNAIPGSRVIMLTSHDSDTEILASLGAGANGFCGKDVSMEELTKGVKTVYAGADWLESSISERALKSCTDARAEQTIEYKSKESILFDREVEIMRLAEQSYSDQPDQYSDVEKFLASPKVSAKPACKSLKDSDNFLFADRYAIDSAISEGGMGIVYKARHLNMDKVVAIKVLKDELAADRRVVRWFQQEAKAASSLNHANIISAFDFGLNELGQPFIVMDYIDGQNLDETIMADGALELQRFFRIFGQVCDGLSAAHSKNIIHCDLKPSNIMLIDCGGRDEVKIVDFGLAKIIPRTSSVQMQMTDRFEVAGSPLYMSPEQCLGQKLDFRSDIYSLACVMYEAITGQPVFDTYSPFEAFGSQLREMPKPFSAVCPVKKIPSYLECIIFKAFNKDPDLRHQSVSELKEELFGGDRNPTDTYSAVTRTGSSV